MSISQTGEVAPRHIRCDGGWEMIIVKSQIWKFVLSSSLLLLCSGCGDHDAASPTATSKLSKEKVNYNQPTPPVQVHDVGELPNVTLVEPVTIPLPESFPQASPIRVHGKFEWPKDVGTLTLMTAEFYKFDAANNREVTLQESFASFKEVDGVIEFQSEELTSPAQFVGRCQFRLCAHFTPKEYDPASGLALHSKLLVVGVGAINIR